MLSPVMRVLLMFCMGVVTGLVAIEVRGWITGARLVNHRQKVLRGTSAAFILVIMAMLLIGDGTARAYHPLAAVGWWFVCFSLAVAVVLMALADMKHVARRFGEERKHNFDDLAERE